MLYFVGTPIGNLGDITLRAIETLKSVDFVCAEDTRVTSKLLTHFDIKKPLISYFEHNKAEKGPQIIERLKAGENGALVTDAGMPGISDPGEDLVRLCIENNIEYTVVPGPVAFVSAAVLSGLSTDGLLFLGFLPDNKKKAQEKLEIIKASTVTTILYEAPHNIKKTLKLLEPVLTDRKLALVREITKIYEEELRGTVSELISYYEENDPRGEYVIVIDGAEKNSETPKKEFDKADLINSVDNYIKNGMKRNEAIKAAAKDFGIARNAAYEMYEK